jgi:hypothetical protein
VCCSYDTHKASALAHYTHDQSHLHRTCVHIHAALNGGAAAKLGSVNRAHIASAKQLASTTPLLRARKGLRLRAVTPPDVEAAAAGSDEQQQSDAPKLSLEDDDDEVLVLATAQQ